MVQTNNRFFDEIGRLMNGAAGMTQGLRREIETMMRSQAERMLRELDVVRREEFEAVKDMARLAREENEALKTRIVALEGGRPAGATSGVPVGSAGATAGATSPSASSSESGRGGPAASPLPSGGVESAGPPATGAQTPSKPNVAAGDPSI